MNLLNSTCATGAIPIGAPGWPEFDLKVASTWDGEYQHALSFLVANSPILKLFAGWRGINAYAVEITYCQKPNGINGKLIKICITHDCDEFLRLVNLERVVAVVVEN
jgi:hypothetical protein